MRMCCAFDNPTLVLKAQGFADASAIRLSIDCFYWLVYAIRGVSGFGDYIMELISQLKPRGLTPDFVFFTICFMYCALQRDGELALAIFDQHFAHQAINPTPEMVLLFIQACAHCEEPRTAMLERSELLIKRLEEVGSSVDLISSIYDQFLELCAQLGAVVSGFSAIKKIVGFGKPLTTRMINSLLLANSNAVASNGSLAMTEELVNFFIMLKIRPNADTHICVTLCTDAFGDSPVVNDFIKSMEDDFQRLSDEGRELPYDEDIPILEVPPHKLRQLRVEWKLKPRDIVLRRFGQHTKPPGKSVLDVGNMRGSVIPFGSAPGERLV
uniref:Uncharacterized protein TCIL3000_8_4570 n=1 Tax=Trypanosoma congolense (strain IL3000) TaxID=1068625 RepID=G0US73_TRYCI|nr:unnamed protein product [Trypanosoma congolense IL3000]